MALSAFAANEIYIRNKPFKGAVSSAGGQTWVELTAFAKALGANLAQNDQGGYAISLTELGSDATANAKPSIVIVDGTPIEAKNDNGTVSVPLEFTAKLLGAKVTVNKELGTTDVNIPTTAVASSAASAGASFGPSKPPKGTVRIHGKITLPGATAVGLFKGGSASTPYKVGTVDAEGNYVMDIELDKDMYALQEGVNITDMRFYREGAFNQCRSRCNFFYNDTRAHKMYLEPYQLGKKFEPKNMMLEYTETK